MLAGTYLFLRRNVRHLGGGDVRRGGLHLQRLQPAALRASARGRHRGASPLAAVGLGYRLARACRKPARRCCLAAIALLTASQILLGYPQYVWF